MSVIGKSESIVFQIEHVSSRKDGSGTLFALSNRLLWSPNDTKNQKSVSIEFHDVKVQKISPDGKSKIQLQICLCNGDAVTFHFTSDKGPERQLEDREKVKEFLQQKMAQVNIKLNGELETKQKILQENKHLFTLYKELVTTSIITPDEFWKSCAKDELSKSNAEQDKSQQKIGVSSGFLSDVTKADGCNGVKLNLTTDIIESVFRTYPSVKTKFSQCVPHEMSEKEFWTKFFQSQYFHRDRHGKQAQATPKEFFADCLKLDNEDIDLQLEAAKLNKRTIQEIDDDRGLAASQDLDDDVRGKTRNQANAELIRKFNYRSSRVLSACLQRADADVDARSKSSLMSLGALLPSTSNDVRNPMQNKRIRLLDSQELTDGQDDPLSQESTSGSALKLARSEKYQICGDRATGDTVANEETKTGTLNAHLNANSVGKWRRKVQQLAATGLSARNLGDDCDHIFDSDASYAALLDLSAVSNSSDSASEKLPKPLVDEVRNIYVASNELLRHFWSCFPTSTVEHEQKLVKMHETLHKFCNTRLKLCSDQLSSHWSIGGVEIVRHLKAMFNAAFAKYDVWKQKK